MQDKRFPLTNVLITVLILITALGIVQNMSKPLDGTMALGAVQPYVASDRFYAGYTNLSLADDTTQWFGLTTLTKSVRLAMAASGGGRIDVSFYQTPTLSGGVAITPRDMNRGVLATAQTIITHSPTIAITGTAVFTNVLVPGGVGNDHRIGGAARNDSEWVLPAWSSYLLGVLNTSGSAISMSLQMQFAER